MKGLLFVAIMALAITINAQDTSGAKYTKTPTGYLMVLTEGDNLLEQLEKLAELEQIPSANFSGMGFVNITFGFFDSKTKEYKPKEFKEVELASMLGSIAWQGGKPSIHAHGVVAGKDFQAYGGHILSATVSTGSLEIMITVHDKKLERVKDEKLGANVLQVE